MIAVEEYPMFQKNIIDLVIQVGFRVMEIYRDQAQWNERQKDDQSPVTQADLEANSMLVEGLTHLAPTVPILAEESPVPPYSERKLWKECWLVDPLDGTKEFILRNGEFTVNVALIQYGRPVMGVVYWPEKDTVYAGNIYSGAFKRTGEEPIRFLKPKKWDNPVKTIVISRNHDSEETQEYLQKYPKAQQMSVGSSLKFMLLAEGHAQLYPRFSPTMEWDTAAAHAIVASLEYRVLDAKTQRDLKYNKENLLNPSFVVQ
jgi:3'(2'), 5'-bisphosphate nucleotidase